LSFSGFAKGKVALESNGRMIAEDILKFHPELQSFLNDIEKQGWRYLYIETRGTALAEIDLVGLQYRVRPGNAYDPSEAGASQNILEIVLGNKTVRLSGVPEVDVFRINVSTKSLPRAVTVDIAKGLVTYVNDTFWAWQTGWEKDERKLSEAREVHEVTKWLLEIKGQKLHESYSMQRYNELSKLLK
jgi:hypothetical protein